MVKCEYVMFRGAACGIRTMAYFSPGATSSVYCFDSCSKQWSRLPDHPTFTFNFSLIVINDLLTTVGGIKSNKLFSFSEGNWFSKGKWVEKFPPMPTKREYPAAVCTGHSLVVAGGHDEGKHLPTVEVMDTNTQQWFTAASLPRGICRASMTACGETFTSWEITQLMSTAVSSKPCYKLAKHLGRPQVYRKPVCGTELQIFP